MSSPTLVTANLATSTPSASAAATTGAVAVDCLFRDTVVIGIEHASAQSISTVTDTQGNTYTKMPTASVPGTGAASLDLWIARIKYPLVNGVDTFTITPSASTNIAARAILLRGAVVASANSSPYDVTKTGTGAATNNPTTGASGTLAVADELAIGYAAFTGNTGGFSSDSTGYSARATVGNASGSLHIGTKVIAATASPGTETYAPTLTGSPANSSVSVITLRGSTIRYADLAAGSNANSGLSTVTAKLTIAASGALAGDIVHVKKTTTPVAASGTATWTAASASITTSVDLTASIAVKDFVSTTVDGTGGWWEVTAITSTTITIVTVYRTGSAGLTGAGLTMYKLTSAASNYIGFDVGSGVAIQASNFSGTQDDPIQIIGGYDFTGDTRTGMDMTWVVNTNATRQSTGFNNPNNNNIEISYYGCGRTGQGFNNAGTGSGSVIDHCHSTSAGTGNAFDDVNGLATPGTFTNCICTAPGANSSRNALSSQTRGAFIDNFVCLGGVGNAINVVGRQSNMRNCIVDGATGGNAYIMAGNDSYAYNCTANHSAVGFNLTATAGSSNTLSTCSSSNATSNDFQVGVQEGPINWFFNCIGNSGTVFNRSSGTATFDKYQQTSAVDGVYRQYQIYGTILSNVTAARSGTCLEIQPGQGLSINSMGPAQGVNVDTRPDRYVEQVWSIPVEAGVTRTVTVYMKKSSTWNGFDCLLGLRANGYWVNGTMPSNMALVVGTGASTILSTAYQQYSFSYDNTAGVAQVIELALQVDGGAGSVYVDDIAWT